MTKPIIIDAKSARYLSDIEKTIDGIKKKIFKDGLPTSVFNKVSADTGGTYLCMNCDSNYILVSPSSNLVKSIAADKNNKYRVLAVRAKVSKKDVKQYLKDNTIKKIAVTWESLDKVKFALDELGEDLSTYRIVYDEYHMILNHFGFRASAIKKMMEFATQFKTFTFMSATPITSKYEIPFLKELPHYEVKWSNERKVVPVSIQTNNTFAAICNIIQQYKKDLYLTPNSDYVPVTSVIPDDGVKVEELCIFVNSVEGIKTILKNSDLKPHEVKIICGDDVRNKVLLDEFPVGEVNLPNKPITFCTSTAFQGVNFFSNNCLCIVATDRNKQNTFINIKRDLLQIAGRYRTDKEYQNIWRDRIWFIYSCTGIDKFDEVEKEIEQMKKDSEEILSLLDKATDDEYDAVFRNYTNCEKDTFLTKEDNMFKYSPLKEMYLREQNEITNYIYTNGIRVREELNNAGFETGINYYVRDESHLKRCKTVSFVELIQAYYEGKHTEDFERQYPEFKEYKKYLTLADIRTLKYNQDDIKKKVEDKKKLDKVFNDIADTDFISNTDLSKQLQILFDKYGITKYKANATLIKKCSFIKATSKKPTIEGKRVEGYEIKRLAMFD